MFKAFVVLCVLSLAAARELTKCEVSHNISPEILAEFNADKTKPSEKILCYFKCEYEDIGNTKDGVVNVDKCIQNVHDWKPLTDETKNEMKECLQKVGNIKTCADVLPSYECIEKGLRKQGVEWSL